MLHPTTPTTPDEFRERNHHQLLVFKQHRPELFARLVATLTTESREHLDARIARMEQEALVLLLKTLESGVVFNPRTTLADVTTPDGLLLGAVPATRQGYAAGDDALVAYTALPGGSPDAELARLRVARRIIVLAGGTPATAHAYHRARESWETAVWRHQRQRQIGRTAPATWLNDLVDEEEAAVCPSPNAS